MAKMATKMSPGRSRNRVRQQWLQTLEQLIQTVELWCASAGWETAREAKPLEESRLGKYDAPVLKVRSPQGIVYVEPVARYVVAGEGLVDLYAWPTMRRMLLVRRGKKWILKTDSGMPWPNPWSERAFFEIIPALAA